MDGLVRYHEGMERPEPGEREAIEGIIAAMSVETDKVADAQGGRAVRASHAKTSGVLKGELRVHDDLAAPFRQGLFATPGASFPALVRFAQGAGEHLSDKVSTHRGMAVKLFGVQGPKLPGHPDDTQDFVFATGPVFPDKDAGAFLGSIRKIESHAGGSETLKRAVSATARGLNAAAKAVTGSDVPRLDFFGHAKLHPLAESYHSQVPLRFGDHVAKLAWFPVTTAQEGLRGATIDTAENPDAFRHATESYFRAQPAVFELRAQLCTDLDTMPIEDASVEWPERDSPYVPVATLTIPPQAAMSELRVRFVEENVSFRPAHSLEAHRPLGSLMRARLAVYGALAAKRQDHNGSAPVEPAGLDAVPD
ncbi:MAG: catalase family protein [Gluconacetobacter diazotrophicus]|nr:catalase family protein [Gluconacetobacter diazotrophicus]